MAPGMFLSQPTIVSNAVIPLGADHSFDTVRNDVAAGQAVAHAVSPHADAVTHPDGVENQPDQVFFLDTLFHHLRQIVQVHVARVAFPASAGNTDLGLVQIFPGQADGVEHGLGGWQAGVLGDSAAVFV